MNNLKYIQICIIMIVISNDCSNTITNKNNVNLNQINIDENKTIHEKQYPSNDEKKSQVKKKNGYELFIKYPKYSRRISKKNSTPSHVAIEKGLDWLKRHQNPKGYWDCDGYRDQCKEAKCTSVGNALNDVGITGLAILAFLGAGNTPIVGQYKDTVSKGIDYLCSVQSKSNGCMSSQNFRHYMYNHGIACLALVECYGLSNYARSKEHSELALKFIHCSKIPRKAWGYNTVEINSDQHRDVSITTWMLLCLVAARDFNLPFHKIDIKDGMRYIEQMTDRDTGRTGYSSKGSFSSRDEGFKN